MEFHCGGRVGHSLGRERGRKRGAAPLGAHAVKACSQLPSHLPIYLRPTRARAQACPKCAVLGSSAHLLKRRFHAGRLLDGCRRALSVGSQARQHLRHALRFIPHGAAERFLILARTGFLERMPLQKQTYKVGSFIFSLMND